MNERRQSDRCKRVTVDVASQMREQMLTIPDKVKPPASQFSMRQLVAELYDAILAMKSRGYNTEDICEFIQRNSGDTISPTTLNCYLRYVAKCRKQARRKKQRQEHRDSVSDPPSSPTQFSQETALEKTPPSVSLVNEVLAAIPDNDLAVDEASTEEGDFRGYMDGKWVEPRFNNTRDRQRL